MKSSAAFLAAIFMLACLAMPVASLESKFLTICEKNLSIDLEPGFEIIYSKFDTSNNEMISNDFFIADNALPGSALISIMTVYDEILTKLNPDALSEIFLIGGVEAAKEDGAKEIGKWTAVDSRGRNVSVTTMKTADEDAKMLDGIYNISVWNLDGTNYALLVSSFDEYNTTQIIKTLAVS
ncbi:hypothetical protein [Methanothrix soehngenii]|jgi:hypothetical protein|uniref:hypothetical protein n=1 Tax=Methanothrix soehngenii TaxID=2223 RepID=UPI0023F06BEB|nr:hypothetical protein [Methanothrix soehngenii]